MSLADLSCLLELAKDRPDAIGDAQMLSEYNNRRHRDIQVRVKGVDLLNRASQAQNPLLRDLRAKGVEALYGLTPVRKTLMRLGLGAKG